MNKLIYVYLLSFSLCLLFPVITNAQEYKYEIGGALGSSFYIGDANRTKLFLHSHPSASVIHRYNLNLNWAVKSNLVVGKVSGNTKDSKNVFPNGNEVTFERTFFELGSQIEFNIFPYSDMFTYMNSKIYSPYLLLGAGITMGTGNETFVNVNVPVGIGIKYKLKDRMNIGAEFTVRKLFGDNFDVVDKSNELNLDSPFGIKSSFIKNKDLYSLVMFFFTWEFGAKYKPCCGDN